MRDTTPLKAEEAQEAFVEAPSLSEQAYRAPSYPPPLTRVTYSNNRPAMSYSPAIPTQDTESSQRLPDPLSATKPTAEDVLQAGNGAESNSLPVWPFAIAAVAGAILALVIIPAWVPTIGGSLVGAEPKGYWYIARAAGLTSFVLLWVSMASGLIITNKVARVWPGAFTAFDLHQFTSLLGLGFIVVHVLVLLGNKYVPYSIMQLLVPFTSTDYRPLWVSIGQVALYIFIPVTFTFYIRKQLGNHMWHLIHLASYAVFALSLLHGLYSGTDSTNAWVQGMYWVTGASLLGLTAHRVLVKNIQPKQAKATGAA